MPHHAQRRRAEQGALHAMSGTVPQDQAWRSASRAVGFLVISQVLIQKSLNLFRTVKFAKNGAFGLVEAGHLDQLNASPERYFFFSFKGALFASCLNSPANSVPLSFNVPWKLP